MAGRSVFVSPQCVSPGRAAPQLALRAGLRVWSLALVMVVLLALAAPRAAVAQAVKGEVTAAFENGYARLVFHLTEEVESQVRLSNNILTISFGRPVDLVVD